MVSKIGLRRTVALIVGILAIVPLSLAQPSPASAADIGDLVVRNGGSSAFLVCRDANPTGTDCKAGIQTLQPGGNSKSQFGWVDTDMIYLPANSKLQIRGVGRGGVVFWSTVATSSSTAKWIKVRGFFGKTETYRVVRV
jgi:hypothetical protein